MAGMIIGCVILLGCAMLFYGISIYVQRREKPMGLWSGIETSFSS